MVQIQMKRNDFLKEGNKI